MTDLIERLRKAAKFGGHYAEAADALDAKDAEIARLRGRLEITHAWRFDENGKKERIELEQPNNFPDGIECRDSTIEILDKNVKVLRARAEAAEAENARLRTALQDIGQSGPVDLDGDYDADAGWSWCYDRARAALDTPTPETPATGEPHD